ncbi:ABC transporter A family member 1 [Phytophthora nicotianae]|uniref:ABC transporter A family member 1 n=1 Tax=Phytophthora nicotianae TaxID=4792 RepID=A0A0W8DLB6_PHYNI|nr:ABC transporter A family member 1 [Phytophthora nicotianae]
MTSVWRRLQLRIAGTTPARRFQEEADVGVAAVLSCFRSLKLDPQNDNKEHEELFDQAVEIVGSKKFEQQKQYVQDEVAKQVQSCFEAVLKMPKDSEKSAPKMSLSGFERNNEVEEKALYPGIVYLPEHYKKFFTEPASNPRNPLAVAHKINHPPSGTSPNVLGFAFEFPPEEPFTTKEYDELIPNNFVQEPSRLSMFGKRAIVHGLAFIATADIADEEELFLNYRYNPDRPMPEWYAPVDVDSDRAMWK